MSNYHGWTHAPKAQGGTDPIPVAGGTSVVHLFDWDYDTINTVPTATWTVIANFGGGAGFYSEAFEAPTGQADMSWNYQTGKVTMLTDAMYDINGWVQFQTDANDGEHRLIALHYGASDRHLEIYPFKTATAAVGQNQLEVHDHLRLGSGSLDVQIQVWHDHGSDIAINDAELTVRRHETIASGEFFVNDPFA